MRDLTGAGAWRAVDDGVMAPVWDRTRVFLWGQLQLQVCETAWRGRRAGRPVKRLVGTRARADLARAFFRRGADTVWLQVSGLVQDPVGHQTEEIAWEAVQRGLREGAGQ
jgi:hypothetical protein